MLTKIDIARAAHKLRYLVRAYPGDKESRRLIKALEDEVLNGTRPRVVPFESRWSYYP